MTSTNLVLSELRRFLQSSEPEVLCLTGDWGVGKTFAWQLVLNEKREDRTHLQDRYSYVSLFGIDSLEGVKLSLFENLEFLDNPPESLAQRGMRSVKSLLAHSKKLSVLASSLPYVGGVLSKAGPLYFSLIRNQLICIDDLERRGTKLDLKDVLGLVAYLREQRECKIILLLNSEFLGDAKDDFETYFEKVIDTRLVFSPTPAEACDVALRSDDIASQLFRTNCETLGISNIRVIKKIERLVRQAEEHTAGMSPEILKRAIHSLTLFGWSKFQPKSAPPVDFYLISSTERYFKQRESKHEPSDTEQKWSALLAKYEFGHMDDFDHELLRLVETGILDVPTFTTKKIALAEQIRLQEQAGTYEEAWRPFHDSFNNNLDEVVHAVIDGLRRSLPAISLSNLNDSIVLLKQLDRPKEAADLLGYFIANKKSRDFWDPSRDAFRSGSYDPDLQAVIEKHSEKDKKPFVFEDELVKAGETYNADSIKELAKIPVAEFYRAIKSKEGEEQRRLINSALGFRRISNASKEMLEVARLMDEALEKIGSESLLNALRVQKYGINVTFAPVEKQKAASDENKPR